LITPARHDELGVQRKTDPDIDVLAGVLAIEQVDPAMRCIRTTGRYDLAGGGFDHWVSRLYS
jgi:hypothetical protein